ncbi:glycoside hydrolase domain-containing protein [Granulicoccus sp. GXG6511]|uniref:glycoside hydrolase domain-containing protein n=1 Tax=Granulicoccus sp. GXG6511 TaxID=3381351 RepID=UPI003D7E3840
MTSRALSAVDPFIGCEPTDLHPTTGIAATWWSPKPQIGNTHPGATFPLGLVSACAYSGAYPTGYGRFDLATEGVPAEIHPVQLASGFTHFQQSGTGAIRKYYNYFRVTPMLEQLESLGRAWELRDERASPGYYAATLDNGIHCELTVGPSSAVHRYTFPRHTNARIVVDFSHGGLTIPFSRTHPLRSNLAILDHAVAAGQIVVEGVPLAVHLECPDDDWKAQLWYDHRRMPGGSRLDFDAIRPTTMRPFGLMWTGPAEAGRSIELRIGFSLRGIDQARTNLERDVPRKPEAFEVRKADTEQAWAEHLGKVHVEAPTAERQTVFDTAVYHSLIKPAITRSESPWWPNPGPFAFDICTMWDIYRTQLPLLIHIAPKKAADLASSLITICEEEGNFPIGYRMARGADRFSRQGSALAHTFLAAVSQAGLPGVDWELALTLMAADLRRTYGEEFLRFGRAEPITHTLDLAFGHWCTAQIATHLGDRALAESLAKRAAGWRNAFDADGRLLRASTFYEGTRWNYSFRILHDMAGRIELAGGDEPFVDLLDDFFGFGAEPELQPGVAPDADELLRGYELGRFQGMNNEPDMDAPWAYTYAGRPDRTAEIVHGVVTNQFRATRGGLPGNDDSGGLSSWYVWAALGLFPVIGQDVYLLNAPAHEHGRMSTGERDLTIDTIGYRAPASDAPPQFVAGATLDGHPIDRAWLSGDEFRRGGHLVVQLADRPTDWATRQRPPSFPT